MPDRTPLGLKPPPQSTATVFLATLDTERPVAEPPACGNARPVRSSLRRTVARAGEDLAKVIDALAAAPNRASFATQARHSASSSAGIARRNSLRTWWCQAWDKNDPPSTPSHQRGRTSGTSPRPGTLFRVPPRFEPDHGERRRLFVTGGHKAAKTTCSGRGRGMQS